MLLLDTTKKL